MKKLLLLTLLLAFCLPNNNAKAANDANSDTQFFHYFKGTDAITDLSADAYTDLWQLSAKDCMDLYLSKNELSEEDQVSDYAKKLAKWTITPPQENMAEIVFVHPAGTIPTPKLEELPILEVVTQVLLGIPIFQFANDFLDNIPELPMIKKTKKLLEKTKKDSKTLPLYTYKKQPVEISGIDLSVKKSHRKAKNYTINELDIAQIAIDEQQLAFNKKEEERLLKALIDSLTESLEASTNWTLRNWAWEALNPVQSLRALVFSLWDNVASDKTALNFVDSFWKKLRTLPTSQVQPKQEYPENDLRHIFSGRAVLYYTDPIIVKPGTYTISLKQHDENGKTGFKDKIKIEIKGGQKYLINGEYAQN